MGLSSSQARLLNLTSRMHQIEYKAAKLEAQKLQMANESTRIYNEYLDALEATKVQVKTIQSDGTASYKDIDAYSDLTSAGFAIKYGDKIYDGSNNFVGSDGRIYKNATIRTLVASDITDGKFHGVNAAVGDKFAQLVDNTWVKCPSDITITRENLTFGQLCHDAFGSAVATPPTNVSEVITNLINTGDCIIIEKDKTNNTWSIETSVAINTSLQEVNDESKLRKAEAKYEADMRKIDAKDRKYDADLAALDTERNAIKSEMETLKTVARDNVERTFKLFS